MTRHFQLMLAAGCLLAFTAVVAAQSQEGGKVDVSGTWLMSVETPNGPGSASFTFKQEGERLSGQYRGAFGDAPVTGTVKGRDVEFSIKVEFQSTELTIVYTGVVDGEEMKGDMAVRGGGQEFKSTWTGKRQQALPAFLVALGVNAVLARAFPHSRAK